MNETAASDNALLADYLSGDYEAFELLYSRHKGGVYRYLLRQLHQQQLVEDIFQEVWSKVIMQASSFQANASFTTWLYTIARHKIIDHIRHIKVVDKVIEPSQKQANTCSSLSESAQDTLTTQTEGQNTTAPDTLHEQGEQANAIEYCLKKLPNHQLDCFLLREESGLSAREIALVVNAGTEATKSRLRSAYRLLRTCIESRIGKDFAHTRGGKAS